MKIFFEEYRYPRELLQKYLTKDYFISAKTEPEKAFTNYVGYFYFCNPNKPEMSDSVFILPKVFVNEKGFAFGYEGLLPESIADLEDINTQKLLQNRQNIRNLIYGLSIWIYKSINLYLEDNRLTKIIETDRMPDIISDKGEEAQTILEIILQLQKFHKENHNLFTYNSIISNSGKNKIHWGKTISSSTPLLIEGQPIYLNLKNKQKAINFDEELIILFYSVLAYINLTYHFDIKMDIQYDLISPYKIKDYINNGKGTRILKNIRKKYFADKLVKLWKLLYIFFDKAERVATGRYHNETLLAKHFERIFEDMVDFLISDGEDLCPDDLRNQDDGKAVDHIFKENSLIYNEDIFYVGDSKYYKKDKLGTYSITKQYTYAKNIIQRNIDEFIFKNNRNKQYLKYRDELTEGYNVTPNFFIFGKAYKKYDSEEFDYLNDHINDYSSLNNEEENSKNNINNVADNINLSRHFSNRLFDRDTLILQKYNINFLFVLTTYATQRSDIKKSFQIKIRNKIRNDLRKILSDKYNFYRIHVYDDNGELDTYSAYEKFVNNNFKLLIGKIFSYEENGKRILILADEKNRNNTDKLYITRNSIFNDTTNQDKIIIAIKVNENTISRVSDNHYLKIHEL